MAKRNQFQRGSGCYTCKMCGKRTRETGGCESGVKMCAACYEDSGNENSHLDGCHEGEYVEADCYLCNGSKPNWEK